VSALNRGLGTHVDMFEVAVRLGVAVLEDGRTIECQTRGVHGLVRLYAKVDAAGGRSELAGYEVWVSGKGKPGSAPPAVLHVHQFARKAIVHLISLVSIGQGGRAIRKAAQEGDGADGRFHAFSLEAQLGTSGADSFSYGRLCGKWTFVVRYDRDAQGTARGGADICGPDLAKALEHWEARIQRKMAEAQVGGAS
jgi:hypothetical protein